MLIYVSIGHELKELEKKAKELGKKMHMNRCCLCFQAFLQDNNGKYTQVLDRVFSDIIIDGSKLLLLLLLLLWLLLLNDTPHSLILLVFHHFSYSLLLLSKKRKEKEKEKSSHFYKIFFIVYYRDKRRCHVENNSFKWCCILGEWRRRNLVTGWQT